MARVYQITEEEMQSLIDSMELAKYREANPNSSHARWFEMRGRYLTSEEKHDLAPVVDDIHRAFHHGVVRWAQAMGFDGRRK